MSPIWLITAVTSRFRTYRASQSEVLDVVPGTDDPFAPVGLGLASCPLQIGDLSTWLTKQEVGLDITNVDRYLRTFYDYNCFTLTLAPDPSLYEPKIFEPRRDCSEGAILALL
jgi:hypothetical protein